MISLKSSGDIPKIVGKIKIKNENRKEFLNLLLNAANCAISNKQGIFGEQIIRYMQDAYKIPVLIRILKLIDEAIRKVEANVNFNYVL